MTWHADDLLLDYRDRRLDAADTASVDAHLTSCARCRATIGTLEDRPSLDVLWDDVVDELDRTPPTVLEQVLGRLGVPDALARLVAATPGLILATALSVVVSVGFGLFLAGTEAPRMIAAFVALAAVVPAIGSMAMILPSPPMSWNSLRATISPRFHWSMKALATTASLATKPPPVLIVGMPASTAFCNAASIALSSTGQ